MRRAMTAAMLAILPLPTVAAAVTIETYRHPPNELNRTTRVNVAFYVLIVEERDVRAEPSSFFKAREKILLA